MREVREQQLKELGYAHIKDPAYWLDKLKLLRTEVLKRYGLATYVRTGRDYGRAVSPVGASSLPKRGGHRKPTSIRVERGSEATGDTIYAVFHDAVHLVLWHNEKGAYKATEAACVVFEHALVKDIYGANVAANYLRDVAYSVGIEHSHLQRSGEQEVGAWSRPQRATWWRKEFQILVRLGVLTEDGKPTYQRADWRRVRRSR